nr:MAG TPA: Repressor protein CI [Caudoviricetes sp.]
MFCKRLEGLRISYNLTQKQLADKLGVTKQTVSNWENDNILPSIETLMRICQFFNVSTDYVLGLDNKKYIEVSDLSLEVVSHIQQIINDIKNNH